MRGSPRMSPQIASITMGMRNAPSRRDPYRSAVPSSPQCTGMLSGRREYAASDMRSAATTKASGSHLRILATSCAAATGRVVAAAFGGADPLEQVVDEVLEDGGVELVDDLLAAALGENEAGVAERAEVARDGGPGGREVLGDLAGRARSVAEESEDLAAGGVGEGAEGVHAGESIT